ncbi:MAG: hypothetical protein ACUVUF_01210 [Candidatus Bathycorpusculaceae bacterium]
MKAKIAVATVSGKAYYLIVNELKKRNLPFLSIIPKEPIPIEIKVVITTEKERNQINHDKVLVFQEDTEPEATVSEAVRILEGRETYERIVIGVDPGEVFGLAVLADGKVIKTENCFSVEETLEKIKTTLKNIENTAATSVSIKVGDGVRIYKERLLEALDEELPLNVVLESVREAGTNRHLSDNKHRRGLRDIVSAIRIAGRSGYAFPRRKENESNS